MRSVHTDRSGNKRHIFGSYNRFLENWSHLSVTIISLGYNKSLFNYLCYYWIWRRQWKLGPFFGEGWLHWIGKLKSMLWIWINFQQYFPCISLCSRTQKLVIMTVKTFKIDKNKVVVNTIWYWSTSETQNQRAQTLNPL